MFFEQVPINKMGLGLNPVSESGGITRSSNHQSPVARVSSEVCMAAPQKGFRDEVAVNIPLPNLLSAKDSVGRTKSRSRTPGSKDPSCKEKRRSRKSANRNKKVGDHSPPGSKGEKSVCIQENQNTYAAFAKERQSQGGYHHAPMTIDVSLANAELPKNPSNGSDNSPSSGTQLYNPSTPKASPKRKPGLQRTGTQILDSNSAPKSSALTDPLNLSGLTGIAGGLVGMTTGAASGVLPTEVSKVASQLHAAGTHVMNPLNQYHGVGGHGGPGVGPGPHLTRSVDANQLQAAASKLATKVQNLETKLKASEADSQRILRGMLEIRKFIQETQAAASQNNNCNNATSPSPSQYSYSGGEQHQLGGPSEGFSGPPMSPSNNDGGSRTSNNVGGLLVAPMSSTKNSGSTEKKHHHSRDRDSHKITIEKQRESTNKSQSQNGRSISPNGSSMTNMQTTTANTLVNSLVNGGLPDTSELGDSRHRVSGGRVIVVSPLPSPRPTETPKSPTQFRKENPELFNTVVSSPLLNRSVGGNNNASKEPADEPSISKSSERNTSMDPQTLNQDLLLEKLGAAVALKRLGDPEENNSLLPQTVFTNSGSVNTQSSKDPLPPSISVSGQDIEANNAEQTPVQKKFII